MHLFLMGSEIALDSPPMSVYPPNAVHCDSTRDSMNARARYRSIQIDYRQALFLGGISSNCRYRIAQVEEVIPLQRQISGNFSRKIFVTDIDSLLNSNEYPLRIQISGSKRINSVTISATTVA